MPSGCGLKSPPTFDCRTILMFLAFSYVRLSNRVLLMLLVHLHLRCRRDRQRAAKEIDESFEAHSDAPRSAVSAIRDDPRLAAAVSFGLGAGLDQVEALDVLRFDVQPGQRVAHHVRAVSTTGKLLPAPGIEAVVAQQRRERPLRPLSFVARADHSPS